MAVVLLGAPQANTEAERTINTAYAQGTYAQIKSVTYFALVAGTTSGTDAVPALSDYTDGTVVWRRVLPRSRKGFVVGNASPTATIWLSDQSFTGSSGVQLAANGGSWTVSGLETPQGQVYCRASATNTPVLTYEW